MNFIEFESHQKLRGGYYTPADIAAFAARWALESGATAILEPSCGDGEFISALGDSGAQTNLQVTGFEILEEEADKARKRARKLKSDPPPLKWSKLMYCFWHQGGPHAA